MKERPIIFSGPSVRAILDGRKTQTRRIVKAPKGMSAEFAGVDFACPYGCPGDRLWVRETHSFYDRECRKPYYQADIDDWEPGGWRSPIFMPRWASRITLEITDVRVQRVQEITEAEAKAEGVHCAVNGSNRLAFATLWDSVNAKRGFSWADNLWVWAITFWRVEDQQ